MKIWKDSPEKLTSLRALHKNWRRPEQTLKLDLRWLQESMVEWSKASDPREVWATDMTPSVISAPLMSSKSWSRFREAMATNSCRTDLLDRLLLKCHSTKTPRQVCSSTHSVRVGRHQMEMYSPPDPNFSTRSRLVSIQMRPEINQGNCVLESESFRERSGPQSLTVPLSIIVEGKHNFNPIGQHSKQQTIERNSVWFDNTSAGIVGWQRGKSNGYNTHNDLDPLMTHWLLDLTVKA